jgi:hypothetical protein
MSLRQIITTEIAAATREGRDFSFSTAVKARLVKKYGVEAVYTTLTEEIRRADIPCIDCYNNEADVSGLISRVQNDAQKLVDAHMAWTFKGAPANAAATLGQLLSPSTQASMLSTCFSGCQRYHFKCSKAPTPSDNWANDELAKHIRKNMANGKDALSRNRLRVKCMQLDGSNYPTAFPISVALWICKREANRRSVPRLACVIDPCAEWGDRLAGAHLSGVVEQFVCIDPSIVSNEICQRVHAKLSTATRSQMRMSTISRGAEKLDLPWPEADLVFTSPPCAQLECYDFAGSPEDGQAWRLEDFREDFLVPLMQNAANSVRARRGRIIINIANTLRKGETLISVLLDAAERADLRWAETLGMRLSNRMTTADKDALRAEPLFVFEF